MPSEASEGSTWNVLVVEDDETVRRQVKEYFAGQVFASRALNISDIPELPEALNLIRERKADLVILDVYHGTAKPGGKQTGVEILEKIQATGFVPVVLYTALPEGLEGHRSSFVRLVGKDAGGLAKLKEEIADLFRLRVPQLHRAVVDHLDKALCAYMWGFAQQRWAEFRPIMEKPEFLRLLLQRLAMTFAHQGIEALTEQVYGSPSQDGATGTERVHPAAFYLKPPVGNDPMLGDIRVRDGNGGRVHLVVLWPSCDMVSAGGRTPKTERVLCATANPATELLEVTEWLASSTETKRKRLEDLIGNNRRVGSPDRYHFLPGVWDIPDLVVDFQALEHVNLAAVRAFPCLATLASPFAESLAARFQRYIGRIGTPDLDVDSVVARMGTLPKAGGNAGIA